MDLGLTIVMAINKPLLYIHVLIINFTYNIKGGCSRDSSTVPVRCTWISVLLGTLTFQMRWILITTLYIYVYNYFSDVILGKYFYVHKSVFFKCKSLCYTSNNIL